MKPIYCPYCGNNFIDDVSVLRVDSFGFSGDLIEYTCKDPMCGCNFFV